MCSDPLNMSFHERADGFISVLINMSSYAFNLIIFFFMSNTYKIVVLDVDCSARITNGVCHSSLGML